MIMEVVHEDMAEGNMLCINHPYKTTIPGGICAFCLQEKLGKLVSSSSPVALFPSSSSSPSPSFRSDFGVTASASAGGVQIIHHVSSSGNIETGGSNCSSYKIYRSRRSKFSFGSTGQKNKNKDGSTSESTSIVLKRSKSTATPRRGMRFLDENFPEDYNPQRRGFWSFLYMTKYSSAKKTQKQLKDTSFAPATPRGTVTSSSVSGATKAGEKKNGDINVVDGNAIERKVSRSRSVGCGSRSFSGDFFERISTGFGDCTLRRVESQREGKPTTGHSDCRDEGNNCGNGQDCIKERVICGGIFSGFIVTSSSSSSSSSSYWVSSSAEYNNNANGEHNSAVNPSAIQLSHGRSRSWGWALASPLRAFAKPWSGKRDSISNKNNVSPNLAAIPSLLTV